MELFLIGLGIGLLLFIISVIAHAHTKNVHKKRDPEDKADRHAEDGS